MGFNSGFKGLKVIHSVWREALKMCPFLAFQFPASLRRSEQTPSSLPTDLGRLCMWLTLPIFVSVIFSYDQSSCPSFIPINLPLCAIKTEQKSFNLESALRETIIANWKDLVNIFLSNMAYLSCKSRNTERNDWNKVFSLCTHFLALLFKIKW